MGKIAVPALRIVLGALLAALVYVQVTLFPNSVTALVEDPRALTFRLGMMVMTFLAIVTIEIVIVCAWRLVTMVRRRTVLSDAALRQLNVAFGALVRPSRAMARRRG